MYVSQGVSTKRILGLEAHVSCGNSYVPKHSTGRSPLHVHSATVHTRLELLCRGRDGVAYHYTPLSPYRSVRGISTLSSSSTKDPQGGRGSCLVGAPASSSACLGINALPVHLYNRQTILYYAF